MTYAALHTRPLWLGSPFQKVVFAALPVLDRLPDASTALNTRIVTRGLIKGKGSFMLAPTLFHPFNSR